MERKYSIDDLKIERQPTVKICGMTARVSKITNKVTGKKSYSCILPLTTNKPTKSSAIKELTFLMTTIKRLRENDK